MTGAEFKAIREELGLNLHEMAKLLNIKHYTMLQRFENGEASIPDSLEQEIIDMIDYQQRRTGEVRDKVIKQFKHFDTEDFYLILMPSQPENNAGLRKAFIKMRLKGQPVHLLYFNPESYNKFKEDTGLEHSDRTLQLWADWYYKNQLYLKRKNIQPKEEPRNTFRWQEESHVWDAD